MLTIYFGNDLIQVRQKALDHVRTLEEGGVQVERITSEQFGTGMLGDMAGTVSLFSGPQAVLLDTLSENTAAFEEFLRDADLLTESNNTFLAIEGNLLVDIKRQLEKSGAKCIESKGGGKEKFNPFLLSDALLTRDRRTLWLLLMNAFREGIAAENIIGTLFWQLKVLRLAEKTQSAEEAGLKPTVFSKAKRALVKFKKGEVGTLSESLLSLYHDGHSGTRNIELALERWVLEL